MTHTIQKGRRYFSSFLYETDHDDDEDEDDGDTVFANRRAVQGFQTCASNAAKTCNLTEPPATRKRPRMDKMTDITRDMCNGEYYALG